MKKIESDRVITTRLGRAVRASVDRAKGTPSARP